MSCFLLLVVAWPSSDSGGHREGEEGLISTIREEPIQVHAGALTCAVQLGPGCVVMYNCSTAGRNVGTGLQVAT